MARPKNSETLVPVYGAVTPGTKAAIEDYRWKSRQLAGQVVREAVEAFLAAKGVTITEPNAAPVESATPKPHATPKA